jgi:hypothetical protein
VLLSMSAVSSSAAEKYKFTVQVSPAGSTIKPRQNPVYKSGEFRRPYLIDSPHT